MEIRPEQFSLIEPSLPVQRGNVRLENLQVINAILYVAEH
ncbi:MAG: transposase, partial [Alphaproteobacteria bacterium]|nr:transposase [Alphaproteobacteria bacterium]